LGNTCSRYSASSHPYVVKIFLLGLFLALDFSIMVGPLVKVDQNYSDITFAARLIDADIINENKILSFSKRPLVTFLYTSLVMFSIRLPSLVSNIELFYAVFIEI
jgi:hypothetical protein